MGTASQKTRQEFSGFCAKRAVVSSPTGMLGGLGMGWGTGTGTFLSQSVVPESPGGGERTEGESTPQLNAHLSRPG